MITDKDPAQTLFTGLEDQSATVGIIGLGYVGLPLAVTVAARGFQVQGFDMDKIKIVKLGGVKVISTLCRVRRWQVS